LRFHRYSKPSDPLLASSFPLPSHSWPWLAFRSLLATGYRLLFYLGLATVSVEAAFIE
jgi:hypothetical protein